MGTEQGYQELEDLGVRGSDRDSGVVNLWVVSEPERETAEDFGGIYDQKLNKKKTM